jgi:hypothetical protein
LLTSKSLNRHGGFELTAPALLSQLAQANLRWFVLPIRTTHFLPALWLYMMYLGMTKYLNTGNKHLHPLTVVIKNLLILFMQ